MKSFLKELNSKQVMIVEVIVVIILIVFALLLRFKFVFGMNHPPLLTDAHNYDVMAKQLLDKNVFGYMTDKSSAYVTPGYPFFLAAIYYVFGNGEASPLLQVRVVQAILGALTCFIVYLIGKRLKNVTVGLIAGFAYAIYPTFAWSPSLILTETIYNFFFMLYIYLQVRIFETKSFKLSFLCGFIFAIAIMIRPVMFPLLVVPFIYHYIVSKDKSTIRIFLYTGIGVLVVMIPWWIRNIIVLHKFIFLATQTGNPFIAGITPYYAKIDISHYYAKNGMLEGSRMLFKGLETQPFLYIKWFTIGKLNYMFGNMWFSPVKGFTFMNSFKLFHFLVIVIGWVGVLFCLVKNRLRIISIFAILLTLMQLMFVPEARYAYSIMPLLMITMAYLLNYLFFDSQELLI